MVVKLQEPNVEEDEYVDAVVSERQGGKNAAYFSSVANTWKARVTEYIDNQGNPESINPTVISIDDKDKFINLYGSSISESVQKILINELRNRQLQLCPACGEDGTPNTLDHYLPKTDYPEYSILSKNLFPMCDICQGEKGTKTVDSDGNRLFIHPYYDVFIDSQVITLIISPPYSSPSYFGLQPHSDLDCANSQLVQRHTDELSLNQRYSHYFKGEYMRLLKLVADMRRSGANIQSSLQLFKQHALLKSINSWGHVFYEGVMSNDDLMEYLLHDDLPANI